MQNSPIFIIKQPALFGVYQFPTMKFKAILLTAVAGACLALPSLGDPATRLIKNESTEASTGLAM